MSTTTMRCSGVASSKCTGGSVECGGVRFNNQRGQFQRFRKTTIARNNRMSFSSSAEAKKALDTMGDDDCASSSACGRSDEDADVVVDDEEAVCVRAAAAERVREPDVYFASCGGRLAK